MSWAITEDFGTYVIRLRNANEAVVDFEVVVVNGEELTVDAAGNNLDIRYYENNSDVPEEKNTTDIDKAAKFIEGSVKWDGCSHVNFAPNDDGYIHFCGKKGAVEIGAILAKVYELASTLMDVHDKDMYNGE